jgi:hypothetical protein
LKIVTDEIEEKLQSNTKVTHTQLKELSDEKRTQLFNNLKEALKTNRPKKCAPVIEEIEGYSLNKDDKTKFEEIKKLIKKFKLSDAMEYLNG